MVKAVFCDVDGTLLNNNSLISETNKFWIKKLVDNNIKFIISSGRPYNALKPIFEMLNFNTEASCTLGSAFYDVNGNRLLHYPLDKETINQLYALAHQYEHTGFSIFSGSELLINIPIIDFVRFNYGLETLPTEGVFAQWLDGVKECDDLTTFLSKDVEKIEFHFKNEDDNKIVFDKLDNLKTINYCNSGYCNIEITAIKANKGEMVKNVCQLYGYSLDEVVTIGDGGNDLTMLKGFKNSFAMGNAPREIKDACTYTTLDNEHDGLAEVIKKILSNNL